MEEHSSTLKVGTMLINKYRIEKLLGEGGFGVVYYAFDTILDRYVALKECLPCDYASRSLDSTTVRAKTQATVEDFEWAKSRFLEEARTLAKFRSNNLLSANNILEANGTVYMDSDFIEGRDLEDVLAGCKICSESEVLHILKGILNGLKEVHSFGLMHRDIKPANIIMRTSDNEPVLIDFGSARMAVTSKTRPLTAMVTQGYAPLEQYYEDGNQGAWTDIYALAGVCYKMITGNKPPESVARIRNDSIIKLSENYKGKYSNNLLNLLDQCLLVEEEKRPQSVDECFDILNKPMQATYSYKKSNIQAEEESFNCSQKSSFEQDAAYKYIPSERAKNEVYKNSDSQVESIDSEQFLSLKKLKSILALILFSCLIAVVMEIIRSNLDDSYPYFWLEHAFFLLEFVAIFTVSIGAVFAKDTIGYKLKLLALPVLFYLCLYSCICLVFSDEAIFSGFITYVGSILYIIVGLLYLIWKRRSFVDIFACFVTIIFIFFMSITLTIIACTFDLFISFYSFLYTYISGLFLSAYIGESLGRKLGVYIKKIFENKMANENLNK